MSIASIFRVCVRPLQFTVRFKNRSRISCQRLDSHVTVVSTQPAPTLLPLIAIFLMCHGSLLAEVRLPNLLSDHMVLQRDTPIHIWGWSGPGEEVTVLFHQQHETTLSNDLGQWSIYLAPESAGGPFQLTVQATDKVTVSDILVGDVWFASGQSNMELPLKGLPAAPVKDGASTIAAATQPTIRLLRLNGRAASHPLNDIDAVWTLCTPSTAADFSAVAYFFGHEIQTHVGVPVGLIDATWGGTFAEAWISLETMTSDPLLLPFWSSYARWMDEQTDLPLVLAREKREDEAALLANHAVPEPRWHPAVESWAPAGIYNAMIAPFTPFPIKGVIWYQGESNSLAEKAPLYGRLFYDLIRDWRGKWREGDFPFLFVQISTFGSTPGVNLATGLWDWGTVRDAQRKTLAVANTAMAVTLDVGDPLNVHPPDKQTVGHRLALAARAIAYGEALEYSGPLFRQAIPRGSEMYVSFDHAIGLTPQGGPLTGFEVAGEDRRFFPASARISGAAVIVRSSQVESPLYVRYAWQNAPNANLFNGAGLPASTFTSEIPYINAAPSSVGQLGLRSLFRRPLGSSRTPNRCFHARAVPST